MKFKVFISLLLVGCVILFGFVFIIIKTIQQEIKNKQFIDEFLSKNDSHTLIPRTEEIPDEIRKKFAPIPEKNDFIVEKPKVIAEFINLRAGDPAALARGGMPAPIFF